MKVELRQQTGDILLCLGVTGALVIVANSDEGRAGPVDPLAYVWAAGLGLLMLFRRRHPLLVLVLTTLGFFAYYAVGLPAIGVAVPIAAALFSATEMGHVRAAVATGVIALGVSTTFRLVTGQQAAFVLGFELITHFTLIAAVIALGHSVRVGRQLRQRTEQLTRLLVRQNQMDADARIRNERLGLARDLHDSIGHSLSVAALYTTVAREAIPAAGRADEALGLVREAISDALTHLRRTVTVLRGRSDPGGSRPGLSDLSQLADAPRAAGYALEVRVDPVEVSPEVGTAAYRLAQEAITNVLRHSSGNWIGVSVEQVEPGRLMVRVCDNGRSAHPPQIDTGHGLSGMRERVAELGGSFEVRAGRRGWTVCATMPTEVRS